MLAPINERNARRIGEPKNGTFLPPRIGRMVQRECRGAAPFLLAVAAAATLAIWSADPFLEWTYEGIMFILAGWVAIRKELRFEPTLVILGLLAVWG